MRMIGKVPVAWHPARRGTAVLVIALSLSALPVVAQAGFTGTTDKQLPVSAAKLSAPAAADTNATMSCSGKSGQGRTTISVVRYGAVAGANNYELTVINPDGRIVFTGDLSRPSGREFTSATGPSWKPGSTWTYEIRGTYEVRGTGNVWSGTPLRGRLACPFSGHDDAGKARHPYGEAGPGHEG